MLVQLGVVAAAFALGAAAQDSAVDQFETKIRPVLAANCYACHSASTPAPQGGLLLDSAQGIRKGGNSGSLVQPGDPEQSLLMRALRHTDKNLKMPPGKPLAAEVVAEFQSWIRSGAHLPADQAQVAKAGKQLWSLRPPTMPALPSVRDPQSIRNDIDRFIDSRLEAKGLTPSPEADKRTLIRRASYDLTGLPPTLAEIEQFTNDRSPDAYGRLVDRLLASPRYGERWGRHWLDVARYADSVNDSVNAGQRYPWSYTYRDWVIRALNEDLPYNQFVQYQIAADRMPHAEPRHLAALGFLSLGREFPKSFPETVDDRIDAVTRGFLGFTVACARCHDHKYDPIPTKDYYSLYSVFSNIRQPKELPLLAKGSAVSPKQTLYDQRLQRIRQAEEEYRIRRNGEMVAFFKTQIAEYLIGARTAGTLSSAEIEELVRERQLNLHMLARWRKHLDASKQSGEPVFRAWHAAAALPDKEFASRWPDVLAEAKGNAVVQAALQAKAASTLRDVAAAYAAVLLQHDRAEALPEPATEELRRVLRGADSPADVPVEQFASIYTEGDSNNMRSILVRYNSMLVQAAQDGAEARAMAVEDVPDPTPGHVFVRGNPNNPGAAVRPRFLSALGGSDDKAFTDGSGRLELAKAIVDPANPLTSRVMVNRVWMHHFGAGLVGTPSDFGFRGDAPTHPELLDYLALTFRDSGWSLKKLHRLIMTSATYRQASADNPAARQVDPENQLLWRMNRRRLDIESLRDSALAAAGRLDTTVGGVPFPLMAHTSVPRRSVYGFIERGRVPGLLSAFDFASPDQHAPIRYVTTVPQQALFFLNSPFIAEQARAIVERPEIAQATSEADRVAGLYRFMLGRAPEKWELTAALQFVKESTEASHGQPIRKDVEPVATPGTWQYGTGEFRAEANRVEKFTPFAMFVSDQWQGGPVLPQLHSGMAVLRAAGGEPGERPEQAVIRRWVSPLSGKLNIEGTLRHGQPAVPYGDGVRGRIVSSREGELASWVVKGSSAETKLSGISVEKGDILDFVVDARSDPENNGFGWAPVIQSGAQTWNASKDFAGPELQPLTVWARYAQVLLQTNEFAFVD